MCLLWELRPVSPQLLTFGQTVTYQLSKLFTDYCTFIHQLAGYLNEA